MTASRIVCGGSVQLRGLFVCCSIATSLSSGLHVSALLDGSAASCQPAFHRCITLSPRSVSAALIEQRHHLYALSVYLALTAGHLAWHPRYFGVRIAVHGFAIILFFYNIALCPRGLSAFCVLLVAHDSAVAVGIVLDHQCTLCNGSSILFNELVVNFCIFNVLVSLLHGCTRHHWIHHPCAFFASLASSRCVLRIFGYVAIHLISSTSRCASLNSTDDLRSMSSFQ